jgi:hypothetical protein
MSLTEVAAVVGAVSGVTALLVNGYTFLRDRARIRLSTTVELPTDRETGEVTGPHVIHLFVANTGRRPEAVAWVGFFVHSRVADGLGVHGPVPFFLPEEPRALDPGGKPAIYKTQVGQLSVKPANEPVIPFVITANGKACWGKARRISSELMEDQWPVPEAPPDADFVLPTHALKRPTTDARIVPRWKLWAPKEMRERRPRFRARPFRSESE